MSTLLKKVSIIIIASVMLFNIGCSKKSDIDKSANLIESQEEYISFEEAIETSDCVVKAKYLSYQDLGDYVEYEFKVEEVLYGNVPESNIYLFSLKGTSHVEEIDFTYDLGGDKYNIGDKYILIMEKNDSLFYDHVRYTLVTDIFIPLNNIKESTMYGQPISVKDVDILNSGNDISNYIQKVKKLSVALTDDEKATYTKSDDMKTIVSEADLILEVTIEDIEVEGLVHNGNTYICDVLDILKGDSLNKGEDGKILVTLLKGSVEVGDNYVVALNKVGEESIIYTQSSKNSIIPVGDENLIRDINLYINE